VLLVAAFAGAVTALQTGYQFTSSVIPLYYAGGVGHGAWCSSWAGAHRAHSGGPIGARYAASWARCVSRQIDALEVWGRSPISHLLLRASSPASS